MCKLVCMQNNKKVFALNSVYLIDITFDDATSKSFKYQNIKIKDSKQLIRTIIFFKN